MDFVGLVFSFLFFYRRVIIGFLLLVGLVYFLMIGRHQVPDLFPDRDRRAVEFGVESENGETANSNSQTDPPNLSNEKDSESKSSVGVVEGPTAADKDPSFVESTGPAVKKSGDADLAVGSRDFKVFLATASVDELINRSLNLKKKSESGIAMTSFTLMDERRNISVRLFEMKLTPVQEKYAVRSFLESVGGLDSINTRCRLGLKVIEEQTQVEVKKYLDYPDSEISSFAHWIMASSAGLKFLEDSTIDKLDDLDRLLDSSFERIVKTPVYSTELAQLVLLVKMSPVFDEQTARFAEKYLAKFEGADLPVTATLKQSLYFSRFQLSTLVERMERNLFEADVVIDDFFAALTEYPTASNEIYQIALDVIREFIRKDNKKRARELTHVLESKLLPKLENEERKDAIEAALDQLKSFF